MENIPSILGLNSSVSHGNTFNSADCDSGAQDMFGDSLSMNELRKAYPELYLFMCQRDPSFEETDIAKAKQEVSWSKLGNSLKDQDFDHGSDVPQLLQESNSVMSILTIRKAMSSIFECLNTVHVQKTLKLRLEIRDLCCRLQSLQTSRELDQREIYRLQRENDRCRKELAQQASRYEDRITELHGVLEELKRKASALVPTVGVSDLVQVSDSDGENDVSDATNVCASPESMLHPSTSQDDWLEFSARRTVRHESWMMGCVHKASSVQSDTVATSRQIDLTSTAASTSGILNEARSQGKPVMGLRQHNQTRKPRIHSQAQLSQASGGGVNKGGNWSRGEGSVHSAHFSQPTSEFSLNFDPVEQVDGLSKTSSTSDDPIRQLHSSALSDSASSVPQSCCSGENICGGEIVIARGGRGDETEPQWVHRCINCCVGTGGREGNAPTTEVVQAFLSGLATEAPYPRLADMARYVLLVCEQHDALSARHEAELAVLEASLAEAKAAGDQLHFRLGQIEASWGAAFRAAELADMALDTSGVLVHLYSSELALLLHKQPHTEGRSKLGRSHYGRSLRRLPPVEFSSTSTSSSSSDEDEPQPLQRASSASRAPVNCHQAITSNGLSQQAHPHAAAANENGNNVYAVYAANGKPSDESSHLSLPTWIPPHAVCKGPACLRLLKMQRHRTEVTALHLLSRFSSAPDSFLKPESLISTAVEDFTTNTINGNRSITTGTESGLGAESGGSSLGTGVHGVYANAWCIAARPFSSTRQAFKPCGGWQTPDSGAGSFSTNEHATNVTAGLVGISGMLNAHTCNSHSSNSSSSSSSSSGAAAAIAVATASGTNTSAASAEIQDDSGWTRVKEMKLRHILDQIILERMLVRSTITVNINDFEVGELHYMKPYDGSELLSYSEGGNMNTAAQESREPVTSNRLNALFMVETAALLQDLCAVKEDRARLKVQNYIMEKELRAIQFSHQGHCLSESALRSQLNTLQIDRNLQMLKTPECCGGHNSFAQQVESLRSAFESLGKRSEQHQSQSEELVNDLKQANAALITAFEKVKSKYLARIRKLESEIAAPSSTPMLPRPAVSSAVAATKRVITSRPPMVPAHKATHLKPPLPPVPPSSTSDVYEVIQDSHVDPIVNLLNPNQLPIDLVTLRDTDSQNSRYSMGLGTPFSLKHPLSTVNRAPPRPR